MHSNSVFIIRPLVNRIFSEGNQGTYPQVKNYRSLEKIEVGKCAICSQWMNNSPLPTLDTPCCGVKVHEAMFACVIPVCPVCNMPFKSNGTPDPRGPGDIFHSKEIVEWSKKLGRNRATQYLSHTQPPKGGWWCHHTDVCVKPTSYHLHSNLCFVFMFHGIPKSKACVHSIQQY